jgi:hypothetical protein
MRLFGSYADQCPRAKPQPTPGASVGHSALLAHGLRLTSAEGTPRRTAPSGDGGLALSVGVVLGRVAVGMDLSLC